MSGSDPYAQVIPIIVERNRKFHGVMDVSSLASCYNFSFAQLQHASSLPPIESDQTQELRTMRHELVHVYQMLATPYGQYYAHLRGFQDAQVASIIRMLKAMNLPLRIPLYKLIGQLNIDAHSDELRQRRDLWFMAEMLLALMEGDTDRFIRLSKLLPDTPPTMLIPMMEITLASFLCETGYLEAGQYPLLNERYKMEGAFHDPRVTGRSQYDYRGESWRLLLEKQNLSIDAPKMDVFVHKLITNADVLAILESWAKVAEYWGFFDQFSTILAQKKSRNYYHLPQWARMRLPKLTTREFCLTFMTICELSLLAPLVPTAFSLRSLESGISDLHPLTRFSSLLDAAAEVKPINDLARDYSRFVHDVCSRLGYPTPYDISVNAINSPISRPGDMRTEIYKISSELRCACPWIFIDLGVWTRRRVGIEQKLRFYFTHPVMEFRDRVIRHKDKAIVLFFHDAYVLHMYMTNVMLSDDMTVTMPHSASGEELVYYESRLKEQLAIAIEGLENPKVRIVPRATAP